jgi:hypothetical protein
MIRAINPLSIHDLLIKSVYVWKYTIYNSSVCIHTDKTRKFELTEMSEHCYMILYYIIMCKYYINSNLYTDNVCVSAYFNQTIHYKCTE